jgi:hypothetical protein
MLLRDLGADAAPAWLALLEHLSCPKCRPNRAWVRRAGELLDGIPAEVFDEFAVRWLDAVRRPIIRLPSESCAPVGAPATRIWHNA